MSVAEVHQQVEERRINTTCSLSNTKATNPSQESAIQPTTTKEDNKYNNKAISHPPPDR